MLVILYIKAQLQLNHPFFFSGLVGVLLSVGDVAGLPNIEPPASSSRGWGVPGSDPGCLTFKQNFTSKSFFPSPTKNRFVLKAHVKRLLRHALPSHSSPPASWFRSPGRPGSPDQTTRLSRQKLVGDQPEGFLEQPDRFRNYRVSR